MTNIRYGCLSVSLLSGWMLWWMTCLFVGHWLFSYGWWRCWIAWLVGGWRACLVEATWREFCLASILHSTPQIGHTSTKCHFLFGNWHSFFFFFSISSFFIGPILWMTMHVELYFYKVSFNCSHTWVEYRFVGYCHFSFLLYLFQANPQIGHTWVKWKLFGDYNFSFLTEEEHRIFQKDKKFNLARIFAYCFIHKCHWIWILHFGIIHIYPHLIYSPDLTENKCDQLQHT